ncbi:MAG: TonB-dependent receptor plug domain-containing protein [Bacteroidales bacterium]
MKTKIFLLLLCSVITLTTVSAQKGNKKNNKKITVSGYVTDQNKKPVANAMVIVDGKNTEKVTNEKGFYKIKVSPDVLKISILTSSSGAVEEIVDGRTNINFTFAGSVPDQPGMKAEDDDVNIGYGTVKKNSLTSPVGSIDANQSKYASYRTIYEVLKAGQVPGVQVVGSSIRIQGASSLTLSTEPLFVVDGVIVNSVDDIMPQMVKSIQVLKGSSAAIYGSRGANGVILITLLKGSDIRK